MNSYFCYNRFMLAPRWLKSLVSACPHRLHSPQQEGIIGGRSEALAFERPIALEASIGRWQTLAIGCLIELERLRVIRHGQRIFHWSGSQLDRAPFEVEQEKKIRSFFSGYGKLCKIHKKQDRKLAQELWPTKKLEQ
jgi:hypothetical protein